MAYFLKEKPMYSESVTAEVKATVSEMLSRIEAEGESAVREYSRRLDNWSPESFVVSKDEAIRSAERVPDELRAHIEFASQQVRGFATAQRQSLSDLEIETLPGVVLGHRHIPVANVGSYVPGGRYPLIASVFMTVVVPKVAGVRRVVVCAPPWQGQGIHPATLYSAAICDADEIVCMGGVQALAAMAFGLGGIEPVDMIVGAGNAYVAEAKRQLFGRVGIDLLAGPTEVLIIADETADPEIVAADLLGQAEHGPNSPAILITTSEELGKDVISYVEKLLETWPTAEVAGAAWRDHGSVVVVETRDEAIALSDKYAPEHLEIQVNEDDIAYFHRELVNYGSLFLGNQATVAYGDKAVGTNHVLPTMGAARYTGGLWVGKFLKTCTYQRLTEEGTSRVGPAVAAISDAEYMEGHGLTATMRLERNAQSGKNSHE